MFQADGFGRSMFVRPLAVNRYVKPRKTIERNASKRRNSKIAAIMIHVECWDANGSPCAYIRFLLWISSLRLLYALLWWWLWPLTVRSFFCFRNYGICLCDRTIRFVSKFAFLLMAIRPLLFALKKCLHDWRLNRSLFDYYNCRCAYVCVSTRTRRRERKSIPRWLPVCDVPERQRFDWIRKICFGPKMWGKNAHKVFAPSAFRWWDRRWWPSYSDGENFTANPNGVRGQTPLKFIKCEQWDFAAQQFFLSFSRVSSHRNLPQEARSCAWDVISQMPSICSVFTVYIRTEDKSVRICRPHSICQASFFLSTSPVRMREEKRETWKRCGRAPPDIELILLTWMSHSGRCTHARSLVSFHFIFVCILNFRIRLIVNRFMLHVRIFLYSVSYS